MMRTTPDRIGFNDDDVLWRVESYLGSRHIPTFRNLVVHVHRGTVTLSGRVENYHQRQVALNSCRRVAGVLKLVDQIEVVPGCGKELRKAVAR